MKNWNGINILKRYLKKVGSGIAILRNAKKFIPRSSLQMNYNALIQPYFDYCSPLWDICGKHLLDKLQKIQNHAARIIAGLSYEIISADVLEALGWETLESRRQRMKSVFLYKIPNDHTAPKLEIVISWGQFYCGELQFEKRRNWYSSF